MYQAWCWISPGEKKKSFYMTFYITAGIFPLEISSVGLCVCHSQPAAGCRTCGLERQATVSPDWDINHTGLEERKSCIY